jgi:hypothetical protein
LRRETNSAAESAIDARRGRRQVRYLHAGLQAHQSLAPRDDWQKFTAETIEIRKMVYVYRKKVIETPDDE